MPVHICPALSTPVSFCKYPCSLPVFTPAHPGSPHLPIHILIHTCPRILPYTPAHTYPHTHLRSDPLRGNLGALRLKVRLVEDRVLPSKYYQPLMKLLAESVLGPAEVGVSYDQFYWEGVEWGLGLPQLWGAYLGSSASESQDPRPPVLLPVPIQEDAASPLAVLEELTSGDCRQDLATKLVKLFLGQGLAGRFLDHLTRREVARTSELPSDPQTSP